MYAEIIAAIHSARTLGDLLKSARSLCNYNDLVAAVSEVNSNLMDATAVALASQEKQSQLASRISDLEKKLEEVEDWKRRFSRYQLHEFPTGTFAYALKAGMEDKGPFYFVCANCINSGKISILQPSEQRNYLICHPCNNSIQIKHKAKPLTPQGGSWMA
jgi:hypothetical protein